MVIDAHGHLIPATVFKELAARPERYPGVKLLPAGETYKIQILDSPPTRPINPLLYEVDKRAQWMAREGLDYQVNGGWLDIFGYELPLNVAVRWHQMMNEKMAEAVAADPKHLGGLASVPLQDGAAAAAELRRARGLGLQGVLIGTYINGRDLDHSDMAPFWAAAVELDMPVLIHPVFAGTNPRMDKYGFPNIIDRAYETVIAAANLIFGGVMERNPGLKILWVHGGGYLPYQVGRLDHGFRSDPAAGAKGGKLPSELVREMWFDHVIFHPPALRYLVDLVGSRKVVLGTDYPFGIGDLQPLRIMDKTPFTTAERQDILTGTSLGLFRPPIG